jgi:branched-subunit amino acid aminotransferase/4-amino-4-deoxychorismate lyase
MICGRHARVYKFQSSVKIFSMSRIWSQGRMMGISEFSVSPFDRGFGLGLGLFETILAVDGVPLWLDRHLERLARAGERLGWQFPQVDMQGIARRVLAENALLSGRARLRLAVTAGAGTMDDLKLGDDWQGWVTAVAAAAVPESVQVVVAPWKRNEHSPLVGLKCASYAENLVALDHARRLGFQETLFFNTAGELCEAAMANIFLVKEGALFTPTLSSGCLPGVARGLILEMAGQSGIPIFEGVLRQRDLDAADEIFLSSALRGPVGVSCLGGKLLPKGPITSLLRGLWQKKITMELASSVVK